MTRPPYKNIIYIFSGRVLDNLITLLLLAVFARLKPESLGIYYFARSIAILVSTFSEVGLSRYTIHTLARDQQKYRVIFGNLLLMRILIFGLAFIILGTALFFLGLDHLTTQAILVITGAVLLFSISDLFLDVLRSREEMLMPVLLITFQRILFVGLGLYGLLWHAGGLRWILLIALLTNLLHMILCATVVIRRNGFPKFSISFKLMHSIISESRPFMVAIMLAALCPRIGIILLYHFCDIETVAHYGAALNIVETILIVAFTVNTAVYPNLVRLFYASHNSHVDGAAAAVKLLLMAIIPIAIGTSMLADQIILFVYGVSFVPSIPLLHVAIWSAVAIFLNSFSTTLLQSMGKQWMAALLVAPLVLAQVILSILLIPKWGSEGAVLATFTSEWGLLIAHMIIINRLFKVSTLFSGISRLIMPLFAMAAVVLFLRQYHVLFPVILGAVIYLTVIVKLHPLTDGEVQWLRTILGRHLMRTNINTERI